MGKFLRALKWSLYGLVLLLGLTLMAGLIYTRSTNFNSWVREQAVNLVNDSIRGSISVERLEGSVWSRLTLFNVTVRHEGVEIARLPRVDVAFPLFPLLRGRLEISELDALKPQADLRQNRQGEWNVVEAFAPRHPEPEQSSAFTTVIRSMRLRDGAIDLRLPGEQENLYRARNLHLEGGIGLLAEGVSLEIRDLATALSSQGIPDLNLKGALEYRQLAGALPILKFRNLWAVSRHSQVNLDGEVVQAEPLQVKARLRLDKLAPADIKHFVADWPLRRDLAGVLTVEGPLTDLQGKINLAAASAKLAAQFRADASENGPRYSASATIDGVDLTQWLANADFAGVVAGTAKARGTGFTLGEIAAEGRLEVRSAQVQGWTLGTLAINGSLEKSAAVFDGRVDGNAGAATWSGKIAGLESKRPTYQASIAIEDLDIRRVAGNGNEALRGRLNLQGTIQGAGFALADMNARTQLRVLPSSLGPVNVSAGEIDVALRAGRVSIARAVLRTAESQLSISGELGLERASKGNLAYRFQSADLAPWLSLAQQKGSGSIQITGEARGSLAEIETQGAVRLARAEVAGFGARSLDAQFSLRGAPARLFPEGVVTLRIAGLDAGLALERVDAKALFTRAQGESIRLDLNAQDSANRKHALEGVLTFPAPGTSFRMNQLSLSAPHGTWRLAQPAELIQEGRTFTIRGLSLRNADRAVTVEGRIGFTGKQDLRLEVDRLPLETLVGFVPNAPKMTGLLALRAHVGGSAAAPEIAANVTLSDPTIAGQAYSGARAEAAYSGKRATMRLTVQQDASRSLVADGVVPLSMSWQDQWRAEAGDGMELRAKSGGLSLSFLNAFAGKTAENIAGEFMLDVIARGSLERPDVRGTFALRDGRARVMPLGVDVSGIAAAGSLAGDKLVLRELSARAKDGEIRATGSLALRNYEIGAGQISIEAKRWPAIDTSRYSVRVGGNLDIQGTLDAPVLKGRVEVSEGVLRPDLEFLEQSKAPVKRDETIRIVRNGVPVAETTAQPGASSAPQADLFKNLALDVSVRAPRNLWIRHSDLQSELSGNVRVAKARGRDIDVTGRIEVVRGWFAFQGRRFQLEQGQIEFTGGDKINPSLQIVAQYKLPDYRVDATIAGSVEKPTLTLSSQPRLEQADILALLLFGRPLDSLNQREQGSLQQSALNLTSGFVAGRIANSVSAALGLDNLGIDIRQVDFGGGRLGFGRYVGGKTYVTFSQELSGDQQQEVGLEYEVAKDWKIGTSATSTGSSGIDIIWHKRY